MKNAVLMAVGALALVPGAASAALILTSESITVPEVPAADVTEFIEVFFQETFPALDEEAIAFSVRLDLIGGSETGVRFAGPAVAPVDHPTIFPGATLTNFGSDFDTIQVASDLASGAANIDDGEGVFRVPVLIPAGTQPGTFPLSFSIADTSFTSQIAGGSDVPFLTQDGAVTVVPEPASFGLMAALGGALALRRRRTA